MASKSKNKSKNINKSKGLLEASVEMEAHVAVDEPKVEVSPKVEVPLPKATERGTEADKPKPPFRFFKALLPNGVWIERRSRMNAYAAVIVIEREDQSFGIWRWTSQAKAVNGQKNLAIKADATAHKIHVLPVMEVEAALPSLDTVYANKREAAAAAKLHGLKASEVSEVEGGFQIKAA